MDKFQAEQLFTVFINAIMEKCAEELGITVDALKHAYVNNADVRKDLDGIFQRHINAL